MNSRLFRILNLRCRLCNHTRPSMRANGLWQGLYVKLSSLLSYIHFLAIFTSVPLAADLAQRSSE
jgi:hypothetical protein